MTSYNAVKKSERDSWDACAAFGRATRPKAWAASLAVKSTLVANPYSANRVGGVTQLSMTRSSDWDKPAPRFATIKGVSRLRRPRHLTEARATAACVAGLLTLRRRTRSTPAGTAWLTTYRSRTTAIERSLPGMAGREMRKRNGGRTAPRA